MSVPTETAQAMASTAGTAAGASVGSQLGQFLGTSIKEAVANLVTSTAAAHSAQTPTAAVSQTATASPTTSRDDSLAITAISAVGDAANNLAKLGGIFAILAPVIGVGATLAGAKARGQPINAQAIITALTAHADSIGNAIKAVTGATASPPPSPLAAASPPATVQASAAPSSSSAPAASA